MSLVLGLQTFVNEVPSQMNQLLTDLSTGRFQVALRGDAFEELSTTGRIHSTRLVLSVLCAGAMVGGAIVALPLAQEFKLARYVLPGLALLAACGTLIGITTTYVFPHGLRKIRLSRLMFWRRR